MRVQQLARASRRAVAEAAQKDREDEELGANEQADTAAPSGGLELLRGATRLELVNGRLLRGPAAVDRQCGAGQGGGLLAA